jgi:hypothetical protein
MQVVHAKDLTTAEKRTILRSWEIDARALQRADDEGMQVGERSRLHDVEIALACRQDRVRRVPDLGCTIQRSPCKSRFVVDPVIESRGG